MADREDDATRRLPVRKVAGPNEHRARVSRPSLGPRAWLFGGGRTLPRVAAAVVVLALAALFATVDREPGTPGTSSAGVSREDGSVHVAAPAGSGSECTEARPCDLDTATSTALPGTEVRLLDGDYPLLRLARTGAPASAAEPVVLRPARDGGQVRIAGMTVKAPGIVLKDLQLTDQLYVDRSATGARVERVHVDGSGVFVRADDSTVTDSLIENGSGLDGLQVKDATGVQITGNTIRHFDATVGGLHADCLQLFDVAEVVIRANTISDCDNASLIFSPGGGHGVRDVLVESNFVSGCRVVSDVCRYGTAIDLRLPTATGIVVHHNTFAGGSVRINGDPDAVIDRNVFGYLSSCSTPMTNSIVRSWNRGLCDRPDAVGRDGNRVGEPEFRDRDNMDFRVAPGAGASVQTEVVQTAGLSAAAATEVVDFDGRPFGPRTVGAAEPGDVGGGQPAPGTAPGPVVPPSGGSEGGDADAPTPGGEVDGIQLVSPDAAAPVEGQVTVALAITGDEPTRVLFDVAGGQLQVEAPRAADEVWSVELDSRDVPNGRYSVEAIVSYADGRQRTAGPWVFTVQNQDG